MSYNSSSNTRQTIYHDLPKSLPPLKPQKSSSSSFEGAGLSSAVGVASPEMDPSKLTLKPLKPSQQELTPDFLTSFTSSPDTSDNDEETLTTYPHSSDPQPYQLPVSSPNKMGRVSQYPLPHGKTYHVFITHSTFDLDMVRSKILTPLTSPPHNFEVASSSMFMKGTEYNNDAIKHAMQQSCSILIGISQPYINSQRCDKEWKRALEYSKNVVVLALGSCSRPQPIKRYLYLDFMDDSKIRAVWNKLIESIDHSTKNSHTPSLQSHRSPSVRSTDTDHKESMNQLFNQLGGGGDQKQFKDQEDYGVTNNRTNDDDVMEHEEYTNNNTSEGSSSGSTSSDSSDSGDDAAGDGLMETGDHDDGANRSQREEGELSDTGSMVSGEGKSSVYIPGSGSSPTEQVHEVAGFYDSLAKPGADNRNESPIFYMRNFNNWVKSILIRKYLRRAGATVLDLCCGKGGDLNKWKEGGIDHLVCADISEVSVERCKERYHSKKMCYHGGQMFTAEFIVADCCETRLQQLYENPARRFNISSCQFSLHYSFESYEKAQVMLQNACENLLPKGYFIGTTVDANELVRRLRRDGSQDSTGAWSVGNDVYSVTLDAGLDPHHDQLPLFNCKYHFKLEGVVNVPEYLVYYPLLVKMLEQFGMKEVLHQNFYDFFHEHRHIPDDVRLMYNMRAFDRKTGTMSTAEWEVIGLYLVFVFEKVS